ncbi:MAG: hypothetical protein E6G50_07030 [Actinobacteria bacterium]|nr:MAG: hypothetical protein E6G50_07030 [Actinomycetota bacterium]
MSGSRRATATSCASVLEWDDGRPLSRTVVPVGSYNVQHADGWVLTPSLGHGDLCILDDEGRVLRSEKVARSSHDACVVTAA